jgi:hypothetical protein
MSTGGLAGGRADQGAVPSSNPESTSTLSIAERGSFANGIASMNAKKR